MAAISFNNSENTSVVERSYNTQNIIWARQCGDVNNPDYYIELRLNDGSTEIIPYADSTNMGTDFTTLTAAF